MITTGNKSYVKRVALPIIGIIIIMIPIIGSLLRGEIFRDSAYYICHAQLVAHGLEPYTDFCFGYTPLWLYLAAALKTLFFIPDGNYLFFLILHYLFILGNAFLLYKISLAWGISERKALLGAFLYTIMSHWLQGNVLLLEPPSIFFGLWSVYIVSKRKKNSPITYALCGLTCACSFLCKQFGLGFLFLNILLLIAVNRAGWKEALIFLGGYSFLILFCFLHWKGEFVSIIFSNYGTSDGGFSPLERVQNIIKHTSYFAFQACPTILLALFLVPTGYQRNKDTFWRMIFCYCGIIGFGLQFFFATDFHYLLFLEPFGILLTILMLQISNKPCLQRTKWIIVTWTILFSMYKTYKCRVYKWYVCENIRKEQRLTAKETSRIIPPNSSLWVAGDEIYLYLLTNTLPPNPKTIGLSFGPLGISMEQSLQQAKDASFVSMPSSEEFLYSDTIVAYLHGHTSHFLHHEPIKIIEK